MMTGWVTNCSELAELLEKQCPSSSDDREWHRHITLIGGIAKMVQIYPLKLVKAILMVLENEVEECGDLSAFDRHRGGPVPDETLVEELDWTAYVDEVTGGALRRDLVEKARAEELAWVHQEQIYEKVPVHQCLERSGKRPMTTRWLDLNKGDEEHPSSRAHFMGRVTREVYIEIPGEDQVGDAEPMCGQLIRSMYETQDASNRGQKDYVELFEKSSFSFGIANYACMHSQQLDARGLVQGDDFAVLADDVARLGPDPADTKETCFLNRIIRHVGETSEDVEKLEIEADARHAALIIEHLGLGAAKPV